MKILIISIAVISFIGFIALLIRGIRNAKVMPDDFEDKFDRVMHLRSKLNKIEARRKVEHRNYNDEDVDLNFLNGIY